MHYPYPHTESADCVCFILKIIDGRLINALCFCCVAKKTTPMVELVEGEESVINLSKVEKTMVAAVQSLKHEYTTSVTTRITPGTYGCCTCCQATALHR